MPAKSKSQQKFMGMVHALQKGELSPSKVSGKVKKVARSINKGDAEDFASTKHKGKPEKVKQETKVRQIIRKMVREIMSEGKRRQLQIPVRDKLKVDKILKKLRFKIGKDYDIGVGKGSTFILDIDNKKLNKALDIFIANRIQVREGFAGALKKEDREEFENIRTKQSEVLGYKLMGTPDIKTEIDDATVKEGKLNETKFLGIFMGKKITVNAKDLSDAKKQIVTKLKVPMTKWGLVSVMSQKAYDAQQFRYEGVEEATKRDYKDEYKKFQSSTKSKKYRAELNAYNRKKGTYGNGDGKDASHKGGKIVGYEKESVNRGRAEKSRLKKEGNIGITTKKGKSIYLTHKTSGKEIVVQNTPSILKKYKRLGYLISMPERKLTEVKETIFDVAARVVKNHQAEKWKGSLMDATSANLLVKVFKKINPKMKQILSKLGDKDPKQLMATLWAVVK